MQIEPTAIPDVVVITPRRFADARGFFAESWNARAMAAAGFDIAFVQDNHSVSHSVGTVRGLHYQTPPQAQGKLVRCGRGSLFDVAVDIRAGSPTYGKWVGVILSAENGAQLWIPPGFAHGFVTRVPETEIIYKCTAHYDAACDAALAWDDPDIGIDWGIAAADAVLSDKDAAAPGFAGFASPFDYARVAR